ncbi:3'-5' exonuclease [Loxospora ochrophaea]|nr:3'-5' exonuclease [Loxospora ochrophaea]
MENHGLSSNWRQLQLALESEKTSNPSSKRKAARDSHSRVIKPRKLLGQRSNLLKLDDTESKVETLAPSASLALWAEDHEISAKDLAAAYGTPLTATSIPELGHSNQAINGGLSPGVEVGKYISIDCEMVGVGPNPEKESALARVSVINYHGQQVYDSFVLPKETVTDYRTFVSGITPTLLRSARPFEVVQADIAKLLGNRILVGHAVRNDLDALMLGHPRRDIRDTSRYPGFKKLAGGRTPSLKKLAKDLLNVDIQGGEHSSVEDARATMLLFRREKKGFEEEHLKQWRPVVDNSRGGARAGKGKGRRKKAKK